MSILVANRASREGGAPRCGVSIRVGASFTVTSAMLTVSDVIEVFSSPCRRGPVECGVASGVHDTTSDVVNIHEALSSVLGRVAYIHASAAVPTWSCMFRGIVQHVLALGRVSSRYIGTHIRHVSRSEAQAAGSTGAPGCSMPLRFLAASGADAVWASSDMIEVCSSS